MTLHFTGRVQKSGFKIAVVALLLVLSGACSNTRLVYNYLDWIVGWHLDDYFELNRDQQHFYDTRLDALLTWHRHEQLAVYAAFIDGIRQDIACDLTAERIHDRYETLQQFWRDIMMTATPDIQALMLSLDAKQRQYFYRVWEKEQQQYEQKYLRETPSERQRRLRRRMEKMLKRFTGRLTGPQKVMVENWSVALVPMQTLWLENRAGWLAVLKEALESAIATGEKKEILRRLFVVPEQWWSDAYRNTVFQNESVTMAMLAKMVENLSEKQKKHLDKVLARLKNDFIHLSKQ